ncbi:PASTA domain-containing protein [Chryseolinea sp. Jin1]|uniref:PASTA domain-containing protein n=1 Tax=Chryseolinea lacunae TaxID=2801331 RepID=A0ABS1KWI0_9BACT|nr:PASTA domain-containing protein [Chryseolinea lacunae]
MKFKRDTLGGMLLHLLLAASALLLVAILYFYAYLPSSTNHNESITVPNTEGMEISKLDDFLGKRTLRYEVTDSSYSSELPPLTVIKQSPPAGAKVKEGRKISITVNRTNPPTVPVPDLVDGSVVNADAVLRSNELKRGRIELVAGPFNVVKAMKYKGQTLTIGDRVPKGAVIDLVVMDGGNKDYPMPDLLSSSYEDAKVPVFGSNLVFGTITLVGDTTGGDAVILKQKPEPNALVRPGDVVDLWIGQLGTEIPEDDGNEN